MIWLLIPDKDNYYYLNYSNLAALSSQEIFEGAPGDRVLSVPPVVTQTSIRLLIRVMMRVMIRVMSIRIGGPKFDITVTADNPHLICDRKDYENIVLAMHGRTNWNRASAQENRPELFGSCTHRPCV